MKKPKADDPAVKLMMTPLIDVTFLILIFLMVLPFKTLERKLTARLPKDRGLAHRIVDLPDPPTLHVVLKRLEGEAATRVVLLDTPLGTGDRAFDALEAGLRRITSVEPDFPGEIDAWANVPHGDVIRALDMFKKANVKEVAFIGAPPNRMR